MEKEDQKRKNRFSASFRTGAIALAFLIIGFELALFLQRAAVSVIVSHRDAPDTVFVHIDSSVRAIGAGSGAADGVMTASEWEASASGRQASGRASGQAGASEESYIVSERHDAPHSARAKALYDSSAGRRVESFRFDPNTVSATDLQRLGFSERQAAAIVRYREAGGRFRRAEDFASSYVVADSVFRRLKPYIDIPLTDINSADSAAFDALPGIGGYFASRMVAYREALGGYSFKEQLLDIYRFDRERFDALSDLIVVGPSEAFPLWSADEKVLASHPYIGKYAAHGIVLFRDSTPREGWNVKALEDAGILDGENAGKLARCRLE